MHGYPCVMHATKRRVKNATTKIVRKAKSSFYTTSLPKRGEIILKAGHVPLCDAKNQKDIMIGKKRVSNGYSNLAGNITYHIVIANGPWIYAVTLARYVVHSAFPPTQHYSNLLMPTDQPAKLTDQTHRQQVKHQSPQTTLDVGPSRNIGHFIARNRHLLDGKFWGPFLSAQTSNVLIMRTCLDCQDLNTWRVHCRI